MPTVEEVLIVYGFRMNENIDVYVACSNSKFLSSDIGDRISVAELE